jgi:PIN domain nuclease of toxin-antitoxin system
MFNAEPGSGQAAELLEGATISAVNFAEVVARLLEWGLSEQKSLEYLVSLDVGVAPFDRDGAIEVGRLRAATRHLGLSLGDRACLATAKMLGVAAVTTDRSWRGLEIGVDVRVIR